MRQKHWPILHRLTYILNFALRSTLCVHTADYKLQGGKRPLVSLTIQNLLAPLTD